MVARSAVLLPSSDAPRIVPLASGCLRLPAPLIRPRAARRKSRRRRRSAALSRQLRGSLQTIPREPGVYLFHDPDDRTLYVGKSVSLRQRVSSYFHASAAGKSRLMVEHAAAVEWLTVGSELEALILESYLIKQHQPPYNVMGREYPRYAFLRLHHGEGFPYLEVTTAITPDGASYYGPFWTMRSAEQALDFVSRLFGLRRCEGDLPPEAEARRCLWGQMHRCQAPCLDEEVRTRYAESVERAARLLQGEVTPLIRELTRARDDAAERLSFERAATLQRTIESLQTLRRRRHHLSTAARSVNFLVLLPADDQDYMQLLAFSCGQLRGQHTFRRSMDSSTTAALGGFLRTTFPTSQRLALDLAQLDEMHVVAEWLTRGQTEPSHIPLPAGPYDEETLAYALEAIRATVEALPGAGPAEVRVAPAWPEREVATTAA